ncbi:hypothetical protein JRQ81_017033 [Phrynocephalus forsythii]|uniref:Uncharacterized protein n=1 Tax=Phrynocephalus forsythii TaxID=171643 RepID=A0A9Q0XWN8_9SAUR|nr:hypothetical protein JRQ81_017033 [Phrynocephalus forsythii]
MATKKEVKDLSHLLSIMEFNIRTDIKMLQEKIEGMAGEIKTTKALAEDSHKKTMANESQIKQLQRRVASLSDSQLRKHIRLFGIPESIHQRDLEKHLLL